MAHEEEGEASRRLTRLSELAAITGSSPAKVQTVIDVFRERGFLLESEDEDPLIDISHESFIRLWSRLHQWVREEAESAAIYARLADSAIHNLAYRDPELSQAIHWKRTQSPNAAWAHRYTPENTFDFPQAMGFLLRKRSDSDGARPTRHRHRNSVQSYLVCRCWAAPPPGVVGRPAQASVRCPRGLTGALS